MIKNTLSAIQVTGNLHLGNYLGSIQNWVKMQNDYNCYFFLADLHSITVENNPDELRKAIINMTAIYLAAGLDPKKSTIFLQSAIKEHTQLAWILNCVTPFGALKRMTQFKDKAGKDQDNANAGLFTYPTLMAADILLYNTDFVPVGADQKQHLELTRDIADAINRKFNSTILKLPEPLIQGAGTRIMNLRDASKKMSKSDASDSSRINLTDSPEIIVKKIKKAKTDNITDISYDKIHRPEISNLIDIFCSLSENNLTDVVNQYKNRGFAIFKNDLSELIISKLVPINNEYQKIIKDKKYIMETLNLGAQKARIVANNNYNLISEKFGFIRSYPCN